MDRLAFEITRGAAELVHHFEQSEQRTPTTIVRKTQLAIRSEQSIFCFLQMVDGFINFFDQMLRSSG